MVKTYKVLNYQPKGHFKYLRVSGGEDEALVSIPIHRFAAVSKGDKIRFGTVGRNRVFVVSKDQNEKDIPVTPLFSTNDTVFIGNERFELRIKEINSVEEMQGLEYLEQFHYKSNASLYAKSRTKASKKANSAVAGRRVVLYATIKMGEHLQPAGYIDLQMPLMMCKPRHCILNNSFLHPERSIHWDCWNQHTMKEYLNSIVRIGRIVVSPELRGIGMTRRIIKAAKSFATERWHIGGVRPIFMEISAEMLKYIDFVTSSGFEFVGLTEGNLKRVITDMEQMTRKPRGEFGIMSLQRKYYRVLNSYCKTREISFEKGIDHLKNMVDKNLDTLTTSEWAILRSIVRRPIPYYLCPLDEYTSNYLRAALKSNPPTDVITKSKAEFSVKSTQIRIESLSIRAAYRVPETTSTKIIMESFGLRGDTVYVDIIRDIEIKASNGNVVLVVGMSGCGKSVFLDALDPAKTIDGDLSVDRKGELNYSAGWLRPLRKDIPLFEVLAEKFTPERTFVALSCVGLSEALAFIKPFNLLSRGQQYRAMIADLLLRNEEVWLLDEFCSDLDPLTAKVVAHNLRKQVIASGRIAFVAAANPTHYLDALRPTKVLMLQTGNQAMWLTYKKYQNEFFKKVI